jgi:hypothetical protein
MAKSSMICLRLKFQRSLDKLRSPNQIGTLLSPRCQDTKGVNLFATKRGIVDDMCKYMHSKKEKGYPIQILRQDNTKENLALIKVAKGKDWKLTIAVELTPRNTPHQNSKAKTAFTVIVAQARSMLIAAQVPDLQRFKMWPEVVMTVTFLNNLVLVIMNEKRKTRWEHAGHKLPAWV